MNSPDPETALDLAEKMVGLIDHPLPAGFPAVAASLTLLIYEAATNGCECKVCVALRQIGCTLDDMAGR